MPKSPPKTPSKPKRLHVINVRLDDETLQLVKEEADKQHRPLANLLAAIIKDYAAARLSAAHQSDAGGKQ